MDSEIADLSRKVNAMYGLLQKVNLSNALASNPNPSSGRETELERAIREAIDDLDKIRNSFKSQQIMTIKEKLQRALEKRAS